MSEFLDNINRRDDSEHPERANAETASGDDVDMSVLTGFAEAQCEGDPDLIVELIDLYLDEFPLQLSAIKDCSMKADAIALKRAAHTLKGSSSNLGVNGVAELCGELELTDLSLSFQQANVLIDRMEQTFARVRPLFLAERQSRI
jgi:HPt (histidine-containing phosphotransfer) domain-containing protein